MISAGLADFAVLFAAGFALGAVRVAMVGSTGQGNLAGVLVELPLMLALAWVACGALVRRFAVPARRTPRAAMGAVAFLLMMIAEAGVSVLGFGRSPAEHLATYRATASLLGLAAQLCSAGFPPLQDRAWRQA